MPAVLAFNVPQVNETTFARHMTIAQAHLLDGVALVGSERTEQFKQAKIAAGQAAYASDIEEELEIATTFVNMVVRMERKGMHR